MIVQFVRVAGVSFNKTAVNVLYSLYKADKNAADKWTVQLIREPENAYDPNAIRVDVNGVKIGYIPRTENEELIPVLGNIRAVVCFMGSARPELPIGVQLGLQFPTIEVPTYHGANHASQERLQSEDDQ